MSYVKQKGMTLIEVVVSTILLSFGLTALIALQLRAGETVRESEMISAATMVANSLGEGAKANPILYAVSDVAVSDAMVIEKSWAHYTGTTYQRANVASDCALDAGAEYTQQVVATKQLCAATTILANTLPKPSDFKLVVCEGENATTAAWPTYGTITCGTGGNDLMVKITWQAPTKTATEASGSALTLEGGALAYGYQVVVGLK